MSQMEKVRQSHEWDGQLDAPSRQVLPLASLSPSASFRFWSFTFSKRKLPSQLQPIEDAEQTIHSSFRLTNVSFAVHFICLAEKQT